MHSSFLQLTDVTHENNVKMLLSKEIGTDFVINFVFYRCRRLGLFGSLSLLFGLLGGCGRLGGSCGRSRLGGNNYILRKKSKVFFF
jgi:hypothetical protein